MTKINKNIIRCDFEGCRKKITLVDEVVCLCRCGKRHCSSHRFDSDHKCTYDFAGAVNREEEIQKIKCIAPKLTSVIS